MTESDVMCRMGSILVRPWRFLLPSFSTPWIPYIRIKSPCNSVHFFANIYIYIYITSLRGRSARNRILTSRLKSPSNSTCFLILKIMKNRLPDDLYDWRFASWSVPGTLYGLPKVHKPGCLIRPILSAINTFNHNLAKFLVPVLSSLTTNGFTVKIFYFYQGYPEC